MRSWQPMLQWLCLVRLTTGFQISPLPTTTAIQTKTTTVLYSAATSYKTPSWVQFFQQQSGNKGTPSKSSGVVVHDFFQALYSSTDHSIDDALSYLSDDVAYDDTAFASSPWSGKDNVERHWRLLEFANLLQDTTFVIRDMVVDKNNNDKKVGLFFEVTSGASTTTRKGCAMIHLNDNELIDKISLFQEQDSKGGEANLRILASVSKVLSLLSSNKNNGDQDESSSQQQQKQLTSSSLSTTGTTLPEQYFQAWNERDMTRAVSLFSDDVEYDDTAFPDPFQGREALRQHLDICANAFPSTFSFVVDELVEERDRLVVQWHVENDEAELAFTNGCSYYQIKKGQIAKGIDFVEPPPLKPGSTTLLFESVKTRFGTDPARFIPLAVWGVYMYVVFFSDWFFGQPATALELRTWEEVRDLSLNFFLVSPILHLPFSPVVHPMLEGVFNLLLSWAALFAGFISDDRTRKPNLFPFLPAVVGMQFLTSAFFLPYLALRSPETQDDVQKGDLSSIAQVIDSPAWGASLLPVGAGSILWGLLARADDFGPLTERWTSFLQLLSIDRVGSSFLVDLAIFGLFQGWLVDDDMLRRGVPSESNLAKAGKYIPFFGLAAYLMFRPSYPSNNESKS